MRELIFKSLRNFFPYVKGGVLFVKGIFTSYNIEGIGRVCKSVDLVFHPGSQISIGRNFLIGRNTTISVSKEGCLKLGDNVGIGPYNHIVARNKIIIGNNTIFGPGVKLFDHNHTYTFGGVVDPTKYQVGEILIGDHCWLGADVIILNNVHVGNNVTIGAGSVVVKDIPDNCVAVGNPATVIKKK